jgi:hypothetical protein
VRRGWSAPTPRACHGLEAVPARPAAAALTTIAVAARGGGAVAAASRAIVPLVPG